MLQKMNELQEEQKHIKKMCNEVIEALMEMKAEMEALTEILIIRDVIGYEELLSMKSTILEQLEAKLNGDEE